MPNLERHVFVCVNRRDPQNPKGCCANRGAEQILEVFKKELHARGLKTKMRANSSGCLDQCKNGPVVVVYPEAVWYRVPTEADALEIIEKHLLCGEPVQRLFLPKVDSPIPETTPAK